MARVMLCTLLLISFLWNAVDAGCGYSDSSLYGPYYYCDYSYYYASVSTIIGAVVGSLFGIVCLIAIIVLFCCIRRGRRATTGRVITNTEPLTVMSTNSGGYINTATYPPGAQINTTYPPGMQASYPQFMYPQQAAGFPQQHASIPSEDQPPPYKNVQSSSE